MQLDLSWFVLIFRHLLIAFGGLAGLEECIEEDKSLKVLFMESYLIEYARSPKLESLFNEMKYVGIPLFKYRYF